MASAIVRLAKTYPLRFGMGYSVFKTAGCDMMVQKVVEKREEIDWKRTAAFGTFGFLYLGGVQYFLYVPVFGRMFPNAAKFTAKPLAEKLKDVKGIRDVFAQVFLDQMVHHPLAYFPAFYMIKDFVTSDKPNPVAAVEEYYTKNMKEDLFALWKVWLPSTFLNFAFMPMWARIPWVATTSLVWTCIISAMRGSSDVPLRDVIVGFDSKTMALVTRTIVGAPLQLNTERSHLLVVLRGPDRPGIVTELTRRLYQMDGSITTSKMMSLGPEFAIMLHVEVPKEKLSDITDDLTGTRLQSHLTGTVIGQHENLQISLRHILPRRVEAPVFAGKVWLTGVDKPGLVYRLCEMLTEQGLNIEHLQTEQHAATDDSPRLFSTHCHVHGSREPDLTVLRQNMRALEKELSVRCDLEVMTMVPTTK